MIDPDNTFVTSDHHFCEWKSRNGFYMYGTEEGDAYHVALWNSIVGPDSLVLYVGDFCDGDAEDLKDLRKRLNGRIVLIKGNHDRLGDETYRAVFEDVVEEMRLDELNIRLIHIKEKIADRRPCERMLYGHLHRGMLDPPQTTFDSLCVCAKWHKWRPISLAEAIRLMDGCNHN